MPNCVQLLTNVLLRLLLIVLVTLCPVNALCLFCAHRLLLCSRAGVLLRRWWRLLLLHGCCLVRCNHG